MINELMVRRSRLMGKVDFYGPLRITLEEAEGMMSLIKSSDIASLKKVAKSTPEYEFYSELIIALLDLGPVKKISPNGVASVSYWQTFQKLLFHNFLKQVKSFKFQYLEEKLFYKLSSLIESNPRYNVQSASQVNPSLGAIVSWVLGIYQYHRGSRPYSLSYTDRRDIGLSEGECCTLQALDAQLVVNRRLEAYLT